MTYRFFSVYRFYPLNSYIRRTEFHGISEVLETRRSVRKYDPNVSVTREQMEELIRAAQEAPSWKNSQTGRYYCVLSEEIVNKIRKNCLPGARNAEKSEHAALIVTTFVHNRAGFQTDGTPDNELGNGWGCYDLGLQNANLILKLPTSGFPPDHGAPRS